MKIAKQRGANIIAELSGYSANSDGFDMVAPSGEGAERCMSDAIKTLSSAPDYIVLMEPVRLSVTLLKDAIKSVFGSSR